MHFTLNIISPSSSVNGNGVAHHSGYTEQQPVAAAAPASKRETKKKASVFLTSP